MGLCREKKRHYQSQRRFSKKTEANSTELSKIGDEAFDISPLLRYEVTESLSLSHSLDQSQSKSLDVIESMFVV